MARADGAWILAASPVEIAGILTFKSKAAIRAGRPRAADRGWTPAQKQRLMARFEAAEEPWACFQQASAGIGGRRSASGLA